MAARKSADDAVEETAEAAPAEAPDPTMYRVLVTVRYEDKDGNEFFCGPGEVIDSAAAAQVDPASIEAI